MLHGEGDVVGHSEASRLSGEESLGVVQDLRHEHAGGVFGGPQEIEGEVDPVIYLQVAQVVASQCVGIVCQLEEGISICGRNCGGRYGSSSSPSSTVRKETPWIINIDCVKGASILI